LIVIVGGHPNSGVVAFQADTGQTLWEGVGKETWDGAQTTWRQEPVYRWRGNEQIASYSSPIAVTIHGKRHVLCLMRHGLVSVDPRDGHVNFKYWFSARKVDSVLGARPVVIDDKIFLTAAYGVGSVLLQVEPSGQSVKMLWNGGMQAHWSTPIHLDGFIYGFAGRYEANASLECVDLTTGKPKWSTTGYDQKLDRLARDSQTGEIKDRATGKVVPFPRFGRGSLTLAGRRFLLLGERGTLALAELSPKGYHELARASFKGIRFPIWPSPVLAGTRLYLRDQNTLMCIDLGRKR
jgi:outer membrane protein assembly factor BamB